MMVYRMGGNPSRELFSVGGGGTDTYASMTELMTNETAWEIKTKVFYTNTLITAIHGGGIEIGCSELVDLASDTAKKDTFSFYGNLSSGNSRLHVTSTNYDEPTLIRMVRRADYVVAIHGAAGSEVKTLIGGLDLVNREIMKEELLAAGFAVEDAPPNLAGMNTNNISNQGQRRMGVQLELTTGQRRAFFVDGNTNRTSRENKANWLPTMYAYAQAINDAIARFVY